MSSDHRSGLAMRSRIVLAAAVDGRAFPPVSVHSLEGVASVRIGSARTGLVEAGQRPSVHRESARRRRLVHNPPERALVLCVDCGHLPLTGAKTQIQPSTARYRFFRCCRKRRNEPATTTSATEPRACTQSSTSPPEKVIGSLIHAIAQQKSMHSCARPTPRSLPSTWSRTMPRPTRHRQ